jgi:3-hydroxymyristoyl/3-hydroxydecanoyl-(acyl carrier protein) dehydratase
MTTEPIVEAARIDGATVELTLVVPADLEYFDGHFEGAPIVPGVVQIKWAIDLASRYLGAAGRFAGFEALKFQSVLQPQQTAILTLRWAAAEGKLHFSYTSGDVRFGSGRILLRAAQ